MTPVLGVVVPAQDEEQELGGCLRAIERATRRVGAAAEVRVVVVLDDCRDRTGAVADRHGVPTVTTTARCVGVARALGCRALIDATGPPVAWLACTDADSRVPADWLLAQLEAWERSYDARVGTVRVTDPSTRRRLRDHYDAVPDPHPHVHGANLGVRADAYLAVGGFAPVAVAEDHALVTALEDGAFRVLRSRDHPVVTSARRWGRAQDGFARRLRSLPDE